MHSTTYQSAEALADFQLLTCEARTPYSESWAARDPNGELWRLQFLRGIENLSPEELADSLHRLQMVQHPNVLRQDVLLLTAGRVVLGSELLARSLSHRLENYREAGKIGIPRAELLDVLEVAAEALDSLHEHYNLQHLLLTPQLLLLDNDDRLHLGDFGPGQLFWHRAGKQLGRMNRRYAAPELFANQVAPTSDQYSLAVLFVELLTGRHPFGSFLRQRQQEKRGTWSANLDELTPPERAVLSRALHENPGRRFDRCTEMVQALHKAAFPAARVPAVATAESPTVACLGALSVEPPAPRIAAAPSPLFQELLGYPVGLDDPEGGRLETSPQHLPGGSLGSRYLIRWQDDLGRLKLRQFVDQWTATVVREEAYGWTFHLPLATTFWQRWRGEQPGLRVELSLRPSGDPDPTLQAAKIEIRPVSCKETQARQLLEYGAPEVLRSLVACLTVVNNRRTRDRVPVDERLALFPVATPTWQGVGITCRARNVSPGGLGLLLPFEMASSQVYLQSAPRPAVAPVTVRGQIVRARPFEYGWFEIGVTVSREDLERALKRAAE